MDKKQGSVLKALQEIESLFEFGGELVPFLEELFGFLSDLMPILAKTSQSLESTTASMPMATDNIASAEMMSEDATHSIMDNLDKMTAQIGDMIDQQSSDSTKTALQGVAHKVAEIQMALQFQDITSQHLRQASQIVEAIQTRMVKLFSSLQEIGNTNELVKSIIESYTEVAPDEVGEVTDTIHRDNSISQADIDALFGA